MNNVFCSALRFNLILDCRFFNDFIYDINYKLTARWFSLLKYYFYFAVLESIWKVQCFQ